MPGSQSTARIKKREFARVIFTEPKLPRYKAAEKAGFSGSMKSLSTTAGRLLDDAVVLAELSDLKRAADAEAIVDYDQVIKGLVKMKQPHMAEFHKHDGSLKQPFELTDEQSRAIKKWGVTKTVTKIERYDKLEANETLGRARHVAKKG